VLQLPTVFSTVTCCTGPSEAKASLRLKNLNDLWVQERNPDILFFSLKSPGKRTLSRFPIRVPMEREARLQGILHISQKPHLGFPVKEPSPKVPFMESLAERCPTTRALQNSSIKVPGIRAPPHTRFPSDTVLNICTVDLRRS
jgi:hypothetical protein